MHRLLPILIAVLSVSAASAQGPAVDGSGSVAVDAAAIGLDAVTDKTELGYEERGAYYGLLHHAQQVDEEMLRQAGRDFLRRRWRTSAQYADSAEEDFPVFADMIHHPGEYRGQPVFLEGHVIRTVKLTADEEFGVDELYECWLITPASQSHPLTVIFSSRPDGLPIGERLVDGVSVAGYFLKLHRYSTLEHKDRFTPLIVAHEVRVRSPRPAAFPLPGWLLSIGAIAAIGAAGILIIRTRQADRRFRREYARKREESLPPSFENLPDDSGKSSDSA